MASRMASGMGAKLRLIGTWVATAILFSGMVFAGWTGFSWIQQITLSDVAIKGNVNTTASDIQDMIKVDTSMVLYDISAVVLEDRLIRHPWIQQADVARLPSGVLDIRIEERKPVAVILGSNDRPDTWVDAAGWRLPITDRAVSASTPFLPGRSERWRVPASVMRAPCSPGSSAIRQCDAR